jgi:hypothetical protein
MSTDPFAMGGTQDDSAILRLFQEWMAAHRDYRAEPDEDLQEALVDRANDLEMEIYRTLLPARSGWRSRVISSATIMRTRRPRSPISQHTALMGTMGRWRVGTAARSKASSMTPLGLSRIWRC